MAGSLGDLGGLLRQAQQMQKQVQEVQEELAKRSFEGTAGGGAVVVRLNGKREVENVAIKPEAVDPDDVEMLEDLVAAALREALKQVEEESAAAMKSVTGGMGMPGMM